MSITLFEIEAKYFALQQQLMDSEGELTPELEAELTINQEELQNKARNYLAVIKTQEGKISTIDEEIKRLQGIKKTIGNVNTRLKDRLLEALILFGTADKKGIKRLEVGTHTLSTRKSTAVLITDETLVDDQFAVWEKKVSKTLLKKAFTDGGNPEGAELLENINLSIR